MPIAAPNPYFKPVIRNRYSETVLALDPNFFYELKSSDIGANSSTRAGAPDAVAANVSQITGHIDGAGDFSSATAELVAPSHSTNNGLTVHGESLTVDMVVKFPSAAPIADGLIISKGQDTSTNIGWFIDYEIGGTLHIYVFTANNWLRYTTDAAMPRDEWIHLAVLLYAGDDNSKEKVWVNGVSVATTHQSNYTGSATADAYPLVIGGRYTDGTPPLNTPIDMQLDSIAGYDYELTDAQVFALARASGLA